MTGTEAGEPGAPDPRRVDAPLGPAWCAAWTATVDRALASKLGEDATGVAVVALGSYGRGELCPASDLDLVLLHDGVAPDRLDALVGALCYPLWDAGLEVGHAVWTPKEVVDAADADTATATSLLSRRVVAGDRRLTGDVDARLQRWLRDAAPRLLTALAAGADAGPAGRLEPDLKTDPGGLRSLHRLDWAAMCLLGDSDLGALAGARYLVAGAHATLVDSAATLLAARCALHQAESRAGDRLRIDLHDEVAARLGLADGDVLLRRVGLAMRTIAHTHDRAWPRLRRGVGAGARAPAEPLDDGVRLIDGLVDVDGDRDPVAEPSLGLRAVAAAAVRGTRLSGASAEWLRERLGSQALPWDPTSRQALLAVLRAGSHAPAGLADADDAGVLSAMLPGWSRVRGRPQRNPFHVYDLDTHLAETVHWLARVAGGELADTHAACWRRLEDPDALWLGAWLHDCGKAWPGDHSTVGADVAADWMRHMGFGGARADRVAALARHHLLLADTATRRDLDDTGEISRVATAVADTEMLDALWLLSLADARASGPATHSPWKDALLATVHRRVRARLQDDAFTPGRPEETAAKARHAALSADAALEPLLTGMPQRYLVAASTAQVLAHAELLAGLGDCPLVCAWRDGEVPGTAVLSVVADDRTGLLADCAGVLAGVGLDLLDARAVTRDDGLAVDWFTVTAGDGAAHQQAADALREAGAGRGDVAGLVAARERRRDARLPREAVLADHAVVVDDDGEQVRVEVTAPNTPGLAYRLTRAAADAGWSVAGLKAESLGAQARVAFFLDGVSGDTGAELAGLLRAQARPPAHLQGQL